MSKIHIVLQGKGGVGKSVLASIIAQYKHDNSDTPLICIDTDPVNQTFAGYKSLNVQRLDIMKDKEIDTRAFDNLMQMFVDEKSADFVIDNGASTFLALSNYFVHHNIPAHLKDMGHQLVVHTVVTGGQALLDTVNGFALLLKQFPDETIFVTWLNPYWGPIEHDGRDFKQLKAYQDFGHRLSAIINIPYMKPADIVDFENMLTKKRTFSDIANDSSLNYMSKVRIKTAQQNLYQQLDNAGVM